MADADGCILSSSLSTPHCAILRKEHDLPRCSAPMSLKLAREMETETETRTFNDDFPALEEKIYKAIELLKSAREGKAAAERDANRLREQLETREEELDVLRGEMIALRKEREEVRGRVEKMLKQIDALVAEG